MEELSGISGRTNTSHFISGSRNSARPRDRMQLREAQRSRLIAAVIGAVEAEGYAGVSVSDVVARARISRKTFYNAFEDLEDCFLAAFERTVAHQRETALVAFRNEDGWCRGLRAGLFNTLDAIDRDRGLARMCVVDSLGAGPRVVARRERVLAEAAHAIDGGRAAATRADPSPLTAYAIAGGIAELLHAALLPRENRAPLTGLLGSLMSIVVLPYLGPAVARREFDAPAPPARRRAPTASPRGAHDLLARLDMRVTYRTVSVLNAIAHTPGASNRRISIDAGVIDKGQISKLLSRLEGLGLVENSRGSRRNNTWYLTSLGVRVQRATRGMP